MEKDTKRLIEKRKDLQLRLQIRASCKQLEEYWLPALVSFQRRGVLICIHYLACGNEAEREIWLSELQEEPWQSLDIQKEQICKLEASPVHTKLFARYPGTLPLRYLPNLTPYTPVKEANQQQILAELKTRLGLTHDPNVLIFYTRFTPVISTAYDRLTDGADEDWMLPMEDLCVAAEDLSWLIFRSMEDEWRYGFAE